MYRTSKVILLIVCLALASMYPLSVFGQTLVVQNGSFEDGDELWDLPGWTCTEGSGIRSTAYYHPPEDASGHSLQLAQTTTPRITQYHQAVSLSGHEGASLLVTGYMLTTGAVEGKIGAAITEDGNCNVSQDAWETVLTFSGEDEVKEQWYQGTSDPLLIPGDSYYLCIFLWGEENYLHFDDISITLQPPTSVHLHDLSANRGRPLLALSILGTTGAAFLMIWRKRSQRSDM
ncbi:MAG: hypothetical protein ACP5HG_07895 [Anaerolineae bacterium]